MVKKGHKYVTLLQINVPRVMNMSQKICLTRGHIFDSEGHLFEMEGHLFDRKGHLFDRKGHLFERKGLSLLKGRNFVTDY